MHVHVLQHVAFEGIGSMAGWLATRQAHVSATRFFESPVLPDLSGLDLVIIMGGPMSVNDEDLYPWLADEKQFLRQAMKRHIPIVGVCLGAQLIASTLGARVFPGREKEIGWYDIEGLPTPNALRLPKRLRVLHWHGETFDLPENAIHLARSTACENQAFQYGDNVIGLQFHLEATPETMAAMVSCCGDELIPGPYVQSAKDITAPENQNFEAVNAAMDAVLEHVTGRVRPVTPTNRKEMPC